MLTFIRVSLLPLLAITTVCCRFGLSNSGLSVYGTWQWVKAQGAWTGSISTPELSGYTEKVVFQESGVAQFYRNDSLLNQIQFTLSKTNIFSRRKAVYAIHWTHKDLPDNQFILFDGNDTLHLTVRTTEISHYYYVRARR